ncbi:MAG: hypothetical protein HQL51_01690 [Magnetococcales bacterium]|nr:hypothetical protein [Magnetococcales bacterium]
MGSPLADLAALLRDEKPATGVVASIRGGVASVATSRGMITASAGPGVAVGARVRIVDGVARRAVSVKPENVYPV